MLLESPEKIRVQSNDQIKIYCLLLPSYKGMTKDLNIEGWYWKIIKGSMLFQQAALRIYAIFPNRFSLMLVFHFFLKKVFKF